MGRPSHYQLEANVNFEDRRHYADINTLQGWVRCDGEVEQLHGRGPDYLSAKTCILFYRRISPRPEYSGPTQDLIECIGRSKPRSRTPVVPEPQLPSHAPGFREAWF